MTQFNETTLVTRCTVERTMSPRNVASSKQSFRCKQADKIADHIWKQPRDTNQKKEVIGLRNETHTDNYISHTIRYSNQFYKQ